MNIERELGKLEISFGTSLALEGAIGEHPDRPISTRPLDNSKQLWINTSTIFRNIYGSLNRTQKEIITSDDLLDFMLYEISVIDGWVASETKGSVETVFYRNMYDKLTAYLPNVIIKDKYTQKQLTYKNLHDSVLNEIPSLLDGIEYRTYDVLLKGSNKTLILTHNPIDLLSHYNFNGGLTLLESHTGKIKPKNHWGSKLGGMAHDNLPFNGFTLQVFGDGGDYINVYGLKARRAVIAIAESDKWTPVTTPGRIKMSVGKVEDPQVKEALMNALDIRSFST